ncbi:hypothetical protein BHE74_00022394 [Ensete ventricosum]|nr:hypothetical protein BHE74_00022394 [Ensete ventricosum]RZR96416.1 hypothetical protein BHM03_00025437 [Ensete ventricosum]
MAFASAVTPPSLFLVPSKPIVTSPRKFPVSAVAGNCTLYGLVSFLCGRRCLSVVVKAMGDSSDTSSDASIVKDVQNAVSCILHSFEYLIR